jgi:hypothetical protein
MNSTSQDSRFTTTTAWLSMLGVVGAALLIGATAITRSVQPSAPGRVGAASAVATANPDDKFAAFERAHPLGTWAPVLQGIVPGMTAPPLLPEPEWAKTVREIPLAEREDGPRVLRNADSVWQVGSVPEDGARLWDEFYVYTSLTPSLALSVMGTYVLNAMDPSVIALDGTFPSARALGRLQIVGATSKSVTFSSSVGVTGSFDFVSHTWTFDP